MLKNYGKTPADSAQGLLPGRAASLKILRNLTRMSLVRGDLARDRWIAPKVEAGPG